MSRALRQRRLCVHPSAAGKPCDRHKRCATAASLSVSALSGKTHHPRASGVDDANAGDVGTVNAAIGDRQPVEQRAFSVLKQPPGANCQTIAAPPWR
ncbi:MAG: hypothetical protein D6709_08770 [Chloroflexi bacterium]|uniref:Uncharacterized protein n=1 Tax=Candidatus Thermofonsia Clade 3 bacterium TaxID=2364212 RepID=A0A2M8QBA1_9CHLR|nr:MAG: hypothetical protein CUN48_10495 [Candidatus Thermofonsia Clade 3 bacterium]RMG63304.1 MAG: hypothetical protein D6709_08770 [Chloroflexota bacterium]